MILKTQRRYAIFPMRVGEGGRVNPTIDPYAVRRAVDVCCLETVFTLSDLHRVTADADASDFVAMLFGAGVYMTRTMHLCALLDVQRSVRLLQSIAYQPGDGATGRRSGSRILT